MKTVVIACIPQDQWVAEELGYALTEEGWSFWISSRDFAQDASHESVIAEALGQAVALLPLISVQSNDSDLLATAIDKAIQLNRLLIPIRLDQVSPTIVTESAVDMGSSDDPNRFVNAIQRLREIEAHNAEAESGALDAPDSGIFITCGEILEETAPRSGHLLAEHRFQVLAAIADGRAGKVYKTWDLRRGAVVTLKNFHESFITTPSVLEHLHQQIAAALKAAHPAFILPRHLVWLANGIFILEEWADGPTLLQLLKTRGSLSLSEAAPLLSGLAEGVDAVYASGLAEVELGLRQVFVNFLDRSASPADFSPLQWPVAQWPAFRVKFSPLSLNLQSRIQMPPLPVAFGRLFYQLLGGQTPQHAFIPLPSLSEKGNHLLKGFLKRPQSTCWEIFERICAAENLPDPLFAKPAPLQPSTLLHGMDSALFPAEQENIFHLWREREKERRHRVRRLQQEQARSMSALTSSMAEASALTSFTDTLSQTAIIQEEEAVGPPPRVSEKPKKRSFLRVAAAAAVLTAAGGGAAVYWLDSQNSFLQKSPDDLFAEYLGELERLEAQREWHQMFGRFPEITERFDGDHELRLLTKARSCIPELFASLESAPEAALIASLDPETQTAIVSQLADKATQLKESVDVAPVAELLAYHAAAFSNRVTPSITELADSVVTHQLTRFEANPAIPDPAEESLLQQLASQGHSQAQSLLEKLTQFEEKERTRLAAAQQKEVFEAEKQQAETWQREKNWRALFAKLSEYADFPGDAQKVLRKIAEASIPARLADLSEAPSAEEIAALDSDAKSLVRKEIGWLATQYVNELQTLARLFRYHESVFSGEVHPALSEIGEQLVARIQAESAPLTDPQIQILTTLQRWNSSEATAVLAKNAELIRELEDSHERWATLKSSLQNAANEKQHLKILLSIDQNPEFLDDEEKGAQLRDFAEKAALALIATNDLPSDDALSELGTVGRGALTSAAEAAAVAATTNDDLSTFLANAKLVRSLSDSNLSKALRDAGSRWVSTLASRSATNPESEAALAQLEDLGISEAAGALAALQEARTRTERFQNDLAEARGLAAQQSWKALFDRIDAYEAYPEQERAQFLSDRQPAIPYVYANLSQAPSASATKALSSQLKALIRPLIGGQALQAVERRDISTFLTCFTYDRNAFGGNLPSEMVRAGNAATEILKADLPRSQDQLKMLGDAGVPDAKSLLRLLEEQEKQREMVERRTAAIAQAENLASRRQIPEALSAFLGLRSLYSTPAEWAETHSSSINGVLARIDSPQSVKPQLTELAKLNFQRAQELLKTFEAPKLTGLAAHRDAYQKNPKNENLLRKYMDEALKAKEFRELETLCFNAFDLGMVDTAFSVLNGLYMVEGIRPSKAAASRLPKELRKKSNAHKGWYGIWLTNGIPPIQKDATNGLPLVKEAAKKGHGASQQTLRAAGIKW